MYYFRFISFTIFLFIYTIPTTVYAQTKTGKITGSLIDRSTQLPVIGANILIDGTTRGAVSDLDGKFSIQLPVGAYTLKISCLGYRTINRTDIIVKTVQPTQILIQMDEEAVKLQNEVLVQGSYFNIPKEIKTSAYTLNYEEVRRQAGASGDVQRIIQSMPGVVPTSDQRNDLVVRGGSPNENITLVDNVEIPNLSHFGAQGASGGPVSMLNTEFINEANFIAGGFPAQYGNKLSSVLSITLREGNRENLAASFDLSIAGAGIIIEGPINDKGSFLFSARRSYLDLVIGSWGSTAVPIYSNYQVKAQYILDGNNKIWFTSIGGIDNIKFEYDATKTDDPETMNTESGGWRIINGINWQSIFDKKGYGVLCLSDALDVFTQKAYNPQNQNRQEFQNLSREGQTTLKYDLVYNFDNIGQLNAGVAAKLFRLHFDIMNPFGKDIPYTKDTTLRDTLLMNNTFTTWESSVYIQFTHTFFDKLEIGAGLRYDFFEYINNKTTIAPRFCFSYHINKDLSFNASYGIFYQMPPLVFLNAVQSNRNMEPINANHYIAGFSYFPYPDTKITLEAYYKKYSDYPVSAEFPTYSMANAGDEYSVSGRLRPMVSSGSGISRGIEFYIQKKLTDQFYGQISYSYSKTEHKALDGIARSGSFDIPHVLSIIGGFKLNDQWEFSTKFTYTSGRPYTPIDYNESFAQNRTIYDLEKTNSLRMPEYHRLDFRFDYRENFSGWNLVTYIEIQNIYNRENAFTIIWNEKTHEAIKIKQIAFFPVGGVKIEF